MDFKNNLKLFHAHIMGLSISGNFRFTLNEFGYAFQGKPVIINDYSIRLFSISPKEYQKKYLRYPDDYGHITPFNLTILKDSHQSEVFASCLGDSEKPGYAQGAIQFIFEALRLFGYTGIYIGRQYTYREKASSWHLASEQFTPGDDEFLRSRFIVLFDNKKRRKFRKFLKVYSNVWKKIIVISHLEIAYRHFLLSLKKSKTEDKILNLIVSLEALLSPSDKNELSHRVSQNAAFMVANKSEIREKIYNLVRESYNVRSKIAHGEFERFKDSHFQKTGHAPEKCVALLRNVVSDCLIRCAMMINVKKDKKVLEGNLLKDQFSGGSETYSNSIFPKMYNHNW